MINLKHKIIAGALLAGAFGAGTTVDKTTPAPFDCKNTTCLVEVQYTESKDRGQIKYSPEEWNIKTTETIKSDIQKRIDDKKKLIDEMSKKVSNDEETI